MHWKRPPGELVYARATDLSCIIKNVYNALYAVKGKEGIPLAMSARNEEKDTLIGSGSFRGHSKMKIQSVASSAGGAAMMAMVAQPHRGHLNGNSRERLRRVPFKKSSVIFVCQSSSSHHHHHLIIISSSSHHHHHLTIIIIFPLSLSLAFLFFSNLAQSSSHEKRARCNPSQGKCVSSVKN